MEWWMLLIGLVAAVGALDALMRALERRGLVHWRQRRRRGTGAGAGMFGELMNAFQPTRHYTIAEQERQRSRVDHAEAGSGAPKIDLDANRITIRRRPTSADGPDHR